MRSNLFFLSVVGALYTGIFLTCTATYAQSHEEQAKNILRLFESGQKDSAYALLEPLKKSARFVPAVLFTRAQMTPDDRALALYKEVIALQPGGIWADQAAYQLVARYADKRDSVGANLWAEVLRMNYPRSPLVGDAEDLLEGIRTWRSPDEDLAEIPRSKEAPGVKETPKAKDASKPKDSPPKEASKTKDVPKTKDVAKETKKADEIKADEKKTEIKKVADKKSDAKKSDEKKDGAAKSTAAAAEKESSPSETYKASGMKGYAIQVGIFPTRDQAEVLSGELKKKNIRSVALPKTVKGAKKYALVVGPYDSIDEANKKKPTIAGACDCQAFIVKVQ